MREFSALPNARGGEPLTSGTGRYSFRCWKPHRIVPLDGDGYYGMVVEAFAKRLWSGCNECYQDEFRRLA